MMKNNIELKQPKNCTRAIHRSLKELVLKELDNLPALLEGLTPQERVRTLLALLPYASPRIEQVKPAYGEEYV